ncbi:MAG TPA: MarR family transcriptional regulator [Pseudonocardiaceae bacterium]
MVKDHGQRPGRRGHQPAHQHGPGLPALPDGVPADQRHETANLLHSAALRLLRLARRADGVLDLDGPRASLLSVLVFAGPLPVTRLAELEQVSPPAITKMVASLEAAGLAARTRSLSDRRVVMVSATTAGRHLLERGRAARVRAVSALLADATDADLRTLRRAADLIAARL